MWVVGVDSGDLRHKQFWIDQERLVFVRSLELGRQDTTIVVEIQFNGYRPLGRGWIAPEVRMFRNGAQMLKEEYAQIRDDAPLPPDFWDAAKLPEVRWMY